MPNCAVCAHFISRVIRTAGMHQEPVCSEHCAAIIIDDEATAQDYADRAHSDAARDYRESQ